MTDSNRRAEAFDSLEKQHKEQLELKSVPLGSPSFEKHRSAVPRNSAMAFVKMKFGVAR